MVVLICYYRMEGLNQTYQDKLFCDVGTAITEQVFFISLFTTIIRVVGTFSLSPINTNFIFCRCFSIIFCYMWFFSSETAQNFKLVWAIAIPAFTRAGNWTFHPSEGILEHQRLEWHGKFTSQLQILTELSCPRWNRRFVVGVSVPWSHHVSCSTSPLFYECSSAFICK